MSNCHWSPWALFCLLCNLETGLLGSLASTRSGSETHQRIQPRMSHYSHRPLMLPSHRLWNTDCGFRDNDKNAWDSFLFILFNSKGGGKPKLYKMWILRQIQELLNKVQKGNNTLTPDQKQTNKQKKTFKSTYLFTGPRALNLVHSLIKYLFSSCIFLEL